MANAKTRAKKTRSKIVESVRRNGIAYPQALRFFLEREPANYLARLRQDNELASFKSLGKNRVHYQLAGQPALDGVGLHRALAKVSLTLLATRRRIVPTRVEVSSLLGVSTLPGADYIVEAPSQPIDPYRVLQLYCPTTAEPRNVATQIVKHLEDARLDPVLADAMDRRLFGFLIALPWLSAQLEKGLKEAFVGRSVRGLGQLRRGGALNSNAYFRVERIAAPVAQLDVALRDIGAL